VARRVEEARAEGPQGLELGVGECKPVAVPQAEQVTSVIHGVRDASTIEHRWRAAVDAANAPAAAAAEAMEGVACRRVTCAGLVRLRLRLRLRLVEGGGV
jgi:hypothetical protein